MCMICKDWELGKLSVQEVNRNVFEAVTDRPLSDEEMEHYIDLVERANEVEDESKN